MAFIPGYNFALLGGSMELTDFISYHAHAIEADEARHNLILGIFARARTNPEGILSWSLGAPGACAVKTPGYPIVLGALSRPQSFSCAERTQDLVYPGVVGSGETALWFVERAQELGISFAEKIPQQIQALTADPAAPGIRGFARQAGLDDFEVFCRWTESFIAEAVPHDPVPSAEAMRNILAQGRHWFWIADERPVAMAAITRRTKNAATINSVYTSPDYRNKGFAGAVTAAVARAIFSEGRKIVCLYTDIRNPASNRCYAKLGFKPVCESWHIVRQPPPGNSS
jgi:ribosomal protein S18 acetylase RimI-like enzyme